MIDLVSFRAHARQRILLHPIMAAVSNQTLARGQYGAYVCDVYHYARHSAVVMGSAAVRLVHSHPALADRLFRLASEELGHEAWARSDLIDLGWTDADIAASAPSPACQEMVALSYLYACHDNPVGVFGWFYVLQSIGADVGQSLAVAIDKALGLDGRGVGFLKGRGEAAAARVEALTEVIARHIVGEEDLYAFGRVAEGSLICYLGILNAAEAGAYAHAVRPPVSAVAG